MKRLNIYQQQEKSEDQKIQKTGGLSPDVGSTLD
jgi:hypothetical protein